MKPHLQTTVLTLLAAGKSQREIERVTGVDRKTICRLAQRQAEVNFSTPATGELPLVLPAVSGVDRGAVAPAAQLHLRRNYTAIYQALVDQFGFTGAYNSGKRFAGLLVQREPEQFDQLEFAPGQLRSTTAKARSRVCQAAIGTAAHGCSL